MQNEYDRIIQERADHVFEVMAKRVSSEDICYDCRPYKSHD